MIKGHWQTREIYIAGKRLSPVPSQRVFNHSPDGFNWGYGGSGPAQLALALLLNFTDKETARRLYQQFKWDFIAKLPRGDFELEISKVKEWINTKKGESNVKNS